jgi:hypothetical protein
MAQDNRPRLLPRQLLQVRGHPLPDSTEPLSPSDLILKYRTLPVETRDLTIRRDPTGSLSSVILASADSIYHSI